MALPFSMLLMRRLQALSFLTPADYDVFFAICTGKTDAKCNSEIARCRMAAASGRHVRTTQKATTRFVEHGADTIPRRTYTLSTRGRPRRCDLGRGSGDAPGRGVERVEQGHAGLCSRIEIVCAGQFRYSTNGSISPSWPV